MVVVQVGEDDARDGVRAHPELRHRRRRLDQARAPAPAPDVGIEAGVDEDRLVGAAHDPEEVVQRLRAVGLAVGLVAVIGVAAGRLERPVAHGGDGPAATHRRPPPRPRPRACATISVQSAPSAALAAARVHSSPTAAPRSIGTPWRSASARQSWTSLCISSRRKPAREGPRQHVLGELVGARRVASAAGVEHVEQRARGQPAVHAERERLAGDRDRAGRQQVVEDLRQLPLAGLGADEHDVGAEHLEDRAQALEQRLARRRP